MEKEYFITGEITGHPIITFKDIDDKSIMLGFVYPIKTTLIVDYEVKVVEIWICSVYDLMKWDIIRKGDKLNLSVLKKQNSSFSPDGCVLKCNIVSRHKG